MVPRNRGCFDPLGSAQENVEREGYGKSGSSFDDCAPNTNTQYPNIVKIEQNPDYSSRPPSPFLCFTSRGTRDKKQRNGNNC